MTIDYQDFKSRGILLPHFPDTEQAGQADDRDIYVRFARHLRAVPNSQPVLKVLSAIQFTADFLGYNDAQVAKTLVDLGLRAPRKAFPAAFLDYVDNALMRMDWEVGGAPVSVQELSDYWRAQGEDPFVRSWRDHVLLDSSAVV